MIRADPEKLDVNWQNCCFAWNSMEVIICFFKWHGKIMDIIFLRGLKIETIIGVFDWEREVKQTIILDLEIATDVRRAAATDCIDDALDYKVITKRIIDFVENSRFQLVETLAERISQVLINEFDIPWLTININKAGAIRGAKDVGVRIERGKHN